MDTDECFTRALSWAFTAVIMVCHYSCQLSHITVSLGKEMEKTLLSDVLRYDSWTENINYCLSYPPRKWILQQLNVNRIH